MCANQMNMSIINELSEYISLRMSSYSEQAHDQGWIEHKSHPDYDLWFIQSGSVKITVDGVEHTAVPGDVVFLPRHALYRLDDRGCLPILIHTFRFRHRRTAANFGRVSTPGYRGG